MPLVISTGRLLWPKSTLCCLAPGPWLQIAENKWKHRLLVVGFEGLEEQMFEVTMVQVGGGAWCDCTVNMGEWAWCDLSHSLLMVLFGIGMALLLLL